MTKQDLASFDCSVNLIQASGVALRKRGPATWFGEAKVPWMLWQNSVTVTDVRMFTFEQNFSREVSPSWSWCGNWTSQKLHHDLSRSREHIGALSFFERLL